MTPVPLHQRPAAVSLAEASRYWCKLGFISFGGPAGQIALMHTELVEKRRWISEQRFLHALNYCMVLPGPEATQLAVYIGWLMHRGIGGVIAGTLFVLPSLLILIALSWIYLAFGSVPAVAGILYGIKPAIVAIVLGAAWRIGQRALKSTALILIAVRCPAGHYRGRRAIPADRLECGCDRHPRRTLATGAIFRFRSTACSHQCRQWSGLDRRRYADARARPFFMVAAGAYRHHRYRARGAGMGRAGGSVRQPQSAGANGLVLYQGGFTDLRWRICRLAVYLSGGDHALQLAHADTNDRVVLALGEAIRGR